MNTFMIAPVVSLYVQHYQFIFIVALLSLAALVFLRSKVVFLIQAALLVTMVVANQIELTVIVNLLAFIQIGITLLVVFRFKRAIDQNYQLVLEKTHAIKRSLTKYDYTGSKKSFFH